MDRLWRSALGLAVAGVLIGAPDVAPAQETGVACSLCVEGAATYGALVGEDFERGERGFGLEVVARRTWESGWGLGAGGRFSFLEIHEGGGGAGTVDIAGLFVEPRFTMAHDDPLRPFVGGRLELLSLEEPGGSDGGFSMGMVGGLDYRVSSGLTLTGSAHSSAMFFGDGRKAAGRELRVGARFRVLDAGS